MYFFLLDFFRDIRWPGWRIRYALATFFFLMYFLGLFWSVSELHRDIDLLNMYNLVQNMWSSKQTRSLESRGRLIQSWRTTSSLERKPCSVHSSSPYCVPAYFNTFPFLQRGFEEASPLTSVRLTKQQNSHVNTGNTSWSPWNPFYRVLIGECLRTYRVSKVFSPRRAADAHCFTAHCFLL